MKYSPPRHRVLLHCAWVAALWAACLVIPQALAPSNLAAAVVATEVFNYSDGTFLDQQTGGSGWSTQWMGFGFTVAGGQADGVFSMPANENFIRRNFANSLATSTMFVGFDLQTPSEITLDGFAGVHLGDLLNGYSLTLGKLPGSNVFYVGSSSGAYASSGITVQPNTTYHLLGGYEVGTNLTSLWINPDTADFYTPGTATSGADAIISHPGLSHAATLNLETSRPGFKIDNLVLGNTPPDVGLRMRRRRPFP